MPDISIFSKPLNQMWKTIYLDQKKGGALLEAAKEEEPEKNSAPVGTLSSEADVDVELAAGRV